MAATGKFNYIGHATGTYTSGLWGSYNSTPTQLFVSGQKAYFKFLAPESPDRTDETGMGSELIFRDQSTKFVPGSAEDGLTVTFGLRFQFQGIQSGGNFVSQGVKPFIYNETDKEIYPFTFDWVTVLNSSDGSFPLFDYYVEKVIYQDKVYRWGIEFQKTIQKKPSFTNPGETQDGVGFKVFSTGTVFIRNSHAESGYVGA